MDHFAIIAAAAAEIIEEMPVPVVAETEEPKAKKAKKAKKKA